MGSYSCVRNQPLWHKLVAALSAAGGPELIEEFGEGEDRGATIPAVWPSLAAPHLSTRACAALNDGDVDAGGGETNGAGKAGDIREMWASLDDVIGWIHAAGGIAVLAHPTKYKLTNLKLEELTRDFCTAGGDALEVISGQQDLSLTTRLGKLAARHGLLASCGSDFHQPGQSWARLGVVATLPRSCTPVWEAW